MFISKIYMQELHVYHMHRLIYSLQFTFCNFSAFDKVSGRRSIAENYKEKVFK